MNSDPAQFCTSKLGVREIIGVMPFTQTAPLQVFTQRWMKTKHEDHDKLGMASRPHLSDLFACSRDGLPPL
jgi:hypothetical protein